MTCCKDGNTEVGSKIVWPLSQAPQYVVRHNKIRPTDSQRLQTPETKNLAGTLSLGFSTLVTKTPL